MGLDIAGTRFLVTGGAGFIGSHTVDALLQNGASVAVVDNLWTGRPENLSSEARFYQLNIADDRVEAVVAEERPEVIYHFAFNVLVPRSVEDPLLDMDALVGSVKLFQAARRHGVAKIVLASSGFLYGNTQQLPTAEDCPIDPLTSYAVSKHAVENYLRFFSRTYGIAHVIFRYATVYGPRQVTGAMADYMRKLASGAQADIWGDGQKTRDYVYVRDVVQANLLALEFATDCPDPTFNIGTGHETTLLALYRHIGRVLGVEANPIFHAERPGEIMRFCLDNAKASAVLGWSPGHTLEEGLELTIGANAGMPAAALIS